MKRKPTGQSSVTFQSEDDLDDEEGESLRSHSPPSMCADSLFSSQSTVDTVAMNKISALEDELSRLRDQITLIMTVKPQTSGKICLH